MKTMKQLNKYLAKVSDNRLVIYQGDGYFYYEQTDEESARNPHIEVPQNEMVCYINQLTAEHWKSNLISAVNEYSYSLQEDRKNKMHEKECALINEKAKVEESFTVKNVLERNADIRKNEIAALLYSLEKGLRFDSGILVQGHRESLVSSNFQEKMLQRLDQEFGMLKEIKEISEGLPSLNLL